MMRTHRVTVTVLEDSIQVNPDTLTMTSKDEVQWSAANSNRFTLEFESAAAFGRQRIGQDDAVRGQRPKAKGRYKYSVVSESNPGLRLDPVIIVEEPPTGTP